MDKVNVKTVTQKEIEKLEDKFFGPEGELRDLAHLKGIGRYLPMDNSVATIQANRYQDQLDEIYVKELELRLQKAVNSIRGAVNYMEASGYGSYPDEEPECQMFEDLKKTLREIK